MSKRIQTTITLLQTTPVIFLKAFLKCSFLGLRTTKEKIETLWYKFAYQELFINSFFLKIVWKSLMSKKLMSYHHIFSVLKGPFEKKSSSNQTDLSVYISSLLHLHDKRLQIYVCVVRFISKHEHVLCTTTILSFSPFIKILWYFPLTYNRKTGMEFSVRVYH